MIVQWSSFNFELSLLQYIGCRRYGLLWYFIKDLKVSFCFQLMLLTKSVLLLLAECSVKSSFIGIGIGMTTPNIYEYSITTPALISFSKNSKIGNFCPLRGHDLPWIRKTYHSPLKSPNGSIHNFVAVNISPCFFPWMNKTGWDKQQSIPSQVREI